MGCTLDGVLVWGVEVNCGTAVQTGTSARECGPIAEKVLAVPKRHVGGTVVQTDTYPLVLGLRAHRHAFPFTSFSVFQRQSLAREGEQHLIGVHGGRAGFVFRDWGGQQEQKQQRHTHDRAKARFKVCREHRSGHQQLPLHRLQPGREHRFRASDRARAVLPSAGTR